jgi:hypothetical protein
MTLSYAPFSLQQPYWVCAIMVLLTGALGYSYMFYKLQSSKVKNGFMYYAFFPVFSSDIVLILNFVPRDFVHLATGKLNTSAWCTVNAFLACAGIVSLNVSMVSIAYMTRELVADRLNKDRSKEIMKKSVLGGWGLGILFSAVMAGAGQLGDYRGLYCCLPTPQEGVIMVPYSIITFGAFCSMVYFYKQAYAIAVEKWRVSSASKKKKAKQADAETKDVKPAQVQEVVVLGIWTTGTFYILWFLVSLLGFVTILGVNDYPPALDAVAGILLKMQPLCNSLIMLRSILKTQ